MHTVCRLDLEVNITSYPCDVIADESAPNPRFISIRTNCSEVNMTSYTCDIIADESPVLYGPPTLTFYTFMTP